MQKRLKVSSIRHRITVTATSVLRKCVKVNYLPLLEYSFKCKIKSLSINGVARKITESSSEDQGFMS